MKTRDQRTSALIPYGMNNTHPQHLGFFKKSVAIPLIHKTNLLHAGNSKATLHDRLCNEGDIKYNASEIFLKLYASLPLQSTPQGYIYSFALVCWQIVTNAAEFLSNIIDITVWNNLMVKEDKRKDIPHESFRAPRVTHFIIQDEANLTIAIEFLQANIDFFAAPFTDPEAFQEWSQANESAMSSLSAGLKACLNSQDQLYAFKKALIGGSATDTNCLRAGNKQSMKDFFLREEYLDSQVAKRLRKNFLVFIIQQKENPVINQWISRNHSTKKCT